MMYRAQERWAGATRPPREGVAIRSLRDNSIYIQILSYILVHTWRRNARARRSAATSCLGTGAIILRPAVPASTEVSVQLNASANACLCAKAMYSVQSHVQRCTAFNAVPHTPWIRMHHAWLETVPGRVACTPVPPPPPPPPPPQVSMPDHPPSHDAPDLELKQVQQAKLGKVMSKESMCRAARRVSDAL